MSGATEAANALRTASLASYPALRDRVGEAARAVIALREVDDIVLVLGAVNALSLAAEALAGAAEELHRAADRALVQAMEATGCHTIAHAGMTVGLRQNAPSVEITDEAAVPPEYQTTPAPRPDRAKIRCALKAGTNLNWASLQPGSVSLTRRTTQ